jgi:Lrp/AsnC family transcriptional regulator for asnA, asnC and gidA
MNSMSSPSLADRPPPAPPTIDDIDREVIERLSNDSRLSNRAIAEALGVTEGTIRARLKRLRDAGLIRFTALTNLSRLGAMRVVFFRVAADLKKVRKVGEALAAMEEIKCVMITTGHHNILAMGPFSTLDDSLETTSEKISAIEGVRGLEMSITIHAMKYNVRTAKILPAQNQSIAGEDSWEED